MTISVTGGATEETGITDNKGKYNIPLTALTQTEIMIFRPTLQEYPISTILLTLQ